MINSFFGKSSLSANVNNSFKLSSGDNMLLSSSAFVSLKLPEAESLLCCVFSLDLLIVLLDDSELIIEVEAFIMTSSLCCGMILTDELVVLELRVEIIFALAF